MKRITGADAFQLQPCQNGFIFVVRQPEVEGKTVVAFKMLDFNDFSITPVTRSVYLLAKFGSQFERFDALPEDYLTARTLSLPDHRLLVCASSGEAAAYTPDGKKAGEATLVFDGEPADSLVLGDDCFWASYPAGGAVVRYSLRSLRPELRVGGGARPLPAPQGLYYQHERLLFCSPQERALLQLNPNDFTVESYCAFEEPVHRYLKYHSSEIVLLDSGVYKL